MNLRLVLRSVGMMRSLPWENDEPIREELFSVERLEDHARSLALAQAVTSRPTRGLSLTARLADNEAVLRSSFRTTVGAVAADAAITPAAEWLIDNFHLVERQIREVRADLPPGYYRQLPKLLTGPFAGYPRVFGVAWAYVAHTDSRFDAEMLRRYVRAYQEVQPLTIGELWAVAITLRIVLIENLRRLAVRIEQSQAERSEADVLADRLLGHDDGVPEPAAALLADRLRDSVSDDFAVQFVHRLQDQNPDVAPALTWLDERLAEAATSTRTATRRVHDRQVGATVTVRNIITSMRLISQIDWLELFERMSPVDDVLSTGELYLAMDFPTRNLYRTAIEELARSSPYSEVEIAAAAVHAASVANVAASETDQRRADPGYYLLAAGRPTLEAIIGYQAPVRHWPQRLSRVVGIQGYGAAILAVAALILLVPLLALSGVVGTAWLIFLGLLAAIPALDAAVGLVNAAVTRSIGATLMPAIELRDGVPAHLRTLVAVPVMLTSLDSIADQIEGLEIHHLASLEGDVHFALLSDWTDAMTETVAGDAALLVAATEGIAHLNARYQALPGGNRFVLLHRRRVWNASQRRWIGWERKRGKLHELNQLLRGASDTNFITADGSAPEAPRDVRFVITLDADTKLPRDTVRRLIGKLAHPLNRPRFDAKVGRVVEGHGVLQPRITPSLPVGEGSLFQRIYSSHSGIDPYAAAVSDVYQDLLGEGSYAGKGIYDVDAFEAALAARAPDSTLLSHDLFEGVFVRAGLASDIEVVEEFPDRYDVASRRHHRWARGDWQLLQWIFSFGRGPNAAVPMTGRFKMLDNLRRSLTAPTCVLALIAGWTILPLSAASLWTAFLVIVMAAPALIPFFDGLLRWPAGGSERGRLRALGDEFELAATRWALTIIFLADQAWLMGDAILRTLVRLTITRRNLLQWVPAAQLASHLKLGVVAFYSGMAGAVLVAGLGIGFAWYWGSGTWPLALAFGLLWTMSPAVARWISTSPERPRRLTVAAEDARKMRHIARQTWRYFEFVVTPADNMLPPDNFQEVPVPVIAHRTSPTNIGVYLLSVVAARDFGWLGTVEAVERLEATFATLARLARFRGHFYNWYDTQDCRVLDPQYVSSVDSGNLAGHLMTVASACREWRESAPDAAVRLAGAGDALDLARAECARHSEGDAASRLQLAAALDTLAKHLRAMDDHGQIDWVGLKTFAQVAEEIAHGSPDDADADLLFWIGATRATIDSHFCDLEVGADSVTARLVALETTARALALDMDFAFLLDADRKLLSIGYSVADGVLDANCYDLLASEARLASYFAIAKGDVPARHWFRLGHAVTPVSGGSVLISWSGSMFEYLMPALIMRPPAGSLLERTECRTVTRQVEYGLQLGTPWGISESAFNARDLELTYQYSNFGVPGLGLKRGLGDNIVIAPYATALAAMVQPHLAMRNFEALEAAGGKGRYGFYEALDYTPTRLPTGSHVAIVRNFMAHHQGMTVIALANTLLDGVMRHRFHVEPMVKAAELLLQERMPRQTAETFPSVAEEGRSAVQIKEIEPPAGRRFASPDTPIPATHLLSNGRYTVMLTAAGSGFSRWRDIAVTRWREDATCDDWGSYIYLRDCGNGSVWSAGFQPSGREPDEYSVTFNEHRAEFVRRDGDLTTTMTVLVSAEDDSEARRISVANAGTQARVIEITSYAELALAPQAADVAHPVFSKLFVETEQLADGGALLAHRRRRDPAEADVWAAHLVVIDGNAIGSAEFETDRAQFLGRGGSARRPRTIIEGRTLSGSTGTVLDPVFALRTRVLIAPGATAHVTFWTMIAASRQAALDLIDKHRVMTDFQRAATLAWTQAQVQLHHLRLSAGDASQFQRLAGRMLYISPGLRPASEAIASGAGAQSGLWSLGISGDLPIVLLRIADIEHLGVARDLVQATDYWRMKRLAFDVVIINERGTSYIQDLQSALEGLVRGSQSRAQFGERAAGAVYVLRADLVPDATRALLLSVARVVLDAQNGRLTSQLDARREAPLPRRLPRHRGQETAYAATAVRPSDLEYFNGLGGFADNGREYVVTLGPGQTTPMPWINVIANAGFGFQVSADGAGFTWAANSREHQLTPWSNDPVQDPAGHAFYIRDDDSGDLFSPTAAPIRDPAGTYVARHGWGYSRFDHAVSGLELDLLEYVPLSDPVRISRLTIRNTSGRLRRLTVAAYVAWVLGPSRAAAAPFTVTAIDPATGAMFATNRWYSAFADRTAFFDLGGRQTSWTGDRREFIGRNGELEDPAALAGRSPFSNWVGAGFDPCGALQTQIELAAGASIEIFCLLGETDSAEAARMLIDRYRAADLDAVLDDVKREWSSVLGAVQVTTPDRSLDIMMNGWLLYQTLTCRIWARSAFYQASGAYGFRDQLQDVAALLTARPELARAQLLLAAGRQFVEGDVQHWWLPQTGNGVRTRFADDRVWLALIAAQYLSVTGDTEVFEEIVAFLDGPTLAPGEAENYFQPTTSPTSANLYEHCARALDASLGVGSHGLPLIGGGDWNDGFNRVGAEGRGESVWMGWFLHAALKAFVPVAAARADEARAAVWTAHAAALATALDAEAWDGDWYRRGWFDDGSPLGSSVSAECRIDSIAQSWAVISGAGDPERARRAMAAAERELVSPETELALLFAPPFDQTELDPGYIKGYPPGIRENGGQYTHAALWSVIALARLGNGDEAATLLAMLNPINHSLTPSEMHRYKVEPYVVAADIYSRPPHIGRGGWTWYTGAAGWMQRAGVEDILGLRIEGAFLKIDPCIPKHWPGFELTLQRGGDRYEIVVENPDGVCRGVVRADCDGVVLAERPLRVAVRCDGKTHKIRVRLG